MEEDELERLAREEILLETQRASARADEVGPQGWMKCPIPPANKRFLCNTLLSTLPDRTRDSTASDKPAKSKSRESKSRHRDKNESKPESCKDIEKSNKRPHSKDSSSKSPKSAKVERHSRTTKK